MFSEPSEGWWNRYGFASLGEYFRNSRTGPDRPASLEPKRKRKDIRAARLPKGADPDPKSRPGPYARTRQISIRLDEDAYGDLLKAAAMYGLPPSTMGRLLVGKGAKNAVGEG